MRINSLHGVCRAGEEIRSHRSIEGVMNKTGNNCAVVKKQPEIIIYSVRFLEII